MAASIIILFTVLLHAIFPTVCSQSVTDIIIVGGGTAGCALAARLCALRPEYQITVLERGVPRNATQAFIAESPRKVWDAWTTSYITEIIPTVTSPQTFNRPFYGLTGNTLGGSSAINGRQWVVPLRPTIESWNFANLTTDSARTYFTRAFRTVGFAPQKGELQSIYAEPYIQAAQDAGFPQNGDPFDDRAQHTMFKNRLAIDKDGHNVNSCDAYLIPAMNGVCAKNLVLKQAATVTKIILRRRNGVFTATGVQYMRVGRDGTRGGKKMMNARVGVIVSAGPYGSPKLLQLSGIGPRYVLQRANVTTLIDLPTGEKTQARSYVPVTSEYSTKLEPSNNSTLLSSPKELQAWKQRKPSVFGASPVFANGRDGLNAYIAGYSNRPQPLYDQRLISSNCHPNIDSFGYLHIKSSDPLKMPEVDFAFLHNPLDLKRLQRCLPKLIRIHSKFSKSHGMKLVLPADGRITKKFIQENLQPVGHYVGGCRVGDVVESDLSVKKTKRLRVVDSSVLRVLPTSSGPLSSVYMLAEYAAEMIAEDW